ncbi:hypothetical protein DAMA08_041700 [Martiniozyma asiatica (nom. inval.)]|nr:hypothetical protein DAMA08_041700 [Martiniozyma asiatica]
MLDDFFNILKGLPLEIELSIVTQSLTFCSNEDLLFSLSTGQLPGLLLQPFLFYVEMTATYCSIYSPKTGVTLQLPYSEKCFENFLKLLGRGIRIRSLLVSYVNVIPVEQYEIILENSNLVHIRYFDLEVMLYLYYNHAESLNKIEWMNFDLIYVNEVEALGMNIPTNMYQENYDIIKKIFGNYMINLKEIQPNLDSPFGRVNDIIRAWKKNPNRRNSKLDVIYQPSYFNLRLETTEVVKGLAENKFLLNYRPQLSLIDKKVLSVISNWGKESISWVKVFTLNCSKVSLESLDEILLLVPKMRNLSVLTIGGVENSNRIEHIRLAIKSIQKLSHLEFLDPLDNSLLQSFIPLSIRTLSFRHASNDKELFFPPNITALNIFARNDSDYDFRDMRFFYSNIRILYCHPSGMGYKANTLRFHDLPPLIECFDVPQSVVKIELEEFQCIDRDNEVFDRFEIAQIK